MQTLARVGVSICRFFQTSHTQVKDYVGACVVLTAGMEYTYQVGAHYTRLLFMLSKTMVRHPLLTFKCVHLSMFVVILQLLLLERKFNDANPLLQTMGPVIETWVQTNTHQKEAVAKQQKEYLQMFFLVLQARNDYSTPKDQEPYLFC